LKFQLPNIFRRRAATAKERQEGVVIGAGYTRFGRLVRPAFDTMIEYYLRDPHVRGHIDDLAESSVGHGFHLESKNKDVLEFAKDWSRIIDLDTKHQNMARELWACGNVILEMVDPPPRTLQKFIHLPISSVKQFFTDEYGHVSAIYQQIESNHAVLRYSKLIHLAWNCIDGSLIGRGLLHSLISSGVGYTWKDSNNVLHKDYRPPYLSVKEEIEDASRKVLIRNVPRHVYAFYGFKDPQVRAHGNTIRGLRPEDDMVVGLPNVKSHKLEVTRVQVDPRSRLHPFFEHFLNGVYTGLETPSPKLFLEAGFTEASAKVAVEVKMQKIAAFRRFLKRKDEALIFKPFVMQQMGTDFTEDDWKDAELRLYWDAEIKKPKIEDLIRLAEISAKYNVPYLPPADLHNMLQKLGFEFSKETLLAAKAGVPLQPEREKTETPETPEEKEEKRRFM